MTRLFTEAIALHMRYMLWHRCDEVRPHCLLPECSGLVLMFLGYCSQVEPDRLMYALTTRVLEMRGEKITTKLTADQVCNPISVATVIISRQSRSCL